MSIFPKPHILLDQANNILEIYLSYTVCEEDGWFFAECPELQVVDQGKTQREAILNLHDMVIETLLEAIQTGNLDRMLRDLGFAKTAVHLKKQFNSSIPSYETMHPLSIKLQIPSQTTMAEIKS